MRARMSSAPGIRTMRGIPLSAAGQNQFGGTAGEPGLVHVGVKREPHAEHARLLPPVGDESAALRPVQREAPHHGEPVGVPARGLESEVIPLALPGRRDDHDAAHAGRVHFLQQHVRGDRIRRLPLVGSVRGPGTLRGVCVPDVHLRVGDEHGHGAAGLSGAGGRRASGRTARGAGAAGPGHSHCRSACAPPCGYGSATARRCRTRCRAGGRTRRG